MSAIRVEHGSAEVTLSSDDYSYADGSVSVSYRPEDLVAATLTALRALPPVGGRYGLPSAAAEWVRAIEAGAESRGLSL